MKKYLKVLVLSLAMIVGVGFVATEIYASKIQKIDEHCC